MYLNPHEIITIPCKGCGQPFSAPRYYNKEYHSVACRRRFKAQRAITRERNALLKMEQMEDVRYFSTITSPTAIQLDGFAQLIADDLTNNLPIRFVGAIPFWNPPDNIAFVEQIGIEPKEWLMFKKEPDVMSLIGNDSPLIDGKL